MTSIVSPKRRSYPVHKDLLEYCSDYFAKALGNSSKEPEQDKIYLAEESPAAVELFISWLYRGDDVLVATETSLAVLLELYITADKWCLTEVQDAVVASTRTWFDENPDKGFESLEPLIKKYYSCLRKLHYVRYRSILQFYAIEPCLFDNGKIEGFHRCVAAHETFAREIAGIQMGLLNRNGQQRKRNREFLRQIVDL